LTLAGSRDVSNELEAYIRRLCLAFPEVEEVVSHGMPNYRPRRGKIFATFAMNHHGDGRIALWLNTPEGMQDAYVRAEPRHFFVPPYVGPSGWLGARLDTGLAWKRLAPLVQAAYERVAPEKLRRQLTVTPSVPGPRRRITVADVDPKNTPRGKRVLKSMRKICLALPATSEGLQFGQSVWRAGKKVFARAYCHQEVWRVAFWVGVHAQLLMTEDPRYAIPPYMGHKGWISLAVSRTCNERELESLALESYRHFASKTMLASL
jgi:predicted DNA-binding protein (MmcQ/YjbR family)